ncbi:MAG: hypothetical protein Q9168_005724 [Polycauliona sp. 1 TL-2023]
MDLSINGRTPAQIYADFASPLSYYIRIGKDSNQTEHLTSLVRHRGPPVLPFCEVVYIVHPFRTTQFYTTGTAPGGVNERQWNRIKKAINGREGLPPGYGECWDPSTVWTYQKYSKVIQPQYKAVSARIAKAIDLIILNKHKDRFGNPSKSLSNWSKNIKMSEETD